MKLGIALESAVFTHDLDSMGFVTENTLYPGMDGYIHRVYRNGERVGTVEACMHCDGIHHSGVVGVDGPGHCPVCGWSGDPDDKPNLDQIWG